MTFDHLIKYFYRVATSLTITVGIIAAFATSEEGIRRHTAAATATAAAAGEESEPITSFIFASNMIKANKPLSLHYTVLYYTILYDIILYHIIS